MRKGKGEEIKEEKRNLDEYARRSTKGKYRQRREGKREDQPRRFPAVSLYYSTHGYIVLRFGQLTLFLRTNLLLFRGTGLSFSLFSFILTYVRTHSLFPALDGSYRSVF